MKPMSKMGQELRDEISEKRFLVSTLYGKKEYEEAIAQHKKLLILMKRDLGHENQQFLRVLDDLVGVYTKLRDLKTASAVTVWGLSARGHEPFPLESIETVNADQLEHLIEIVQLELRNSGRRKIAAC